ncbi:UDP-3-O-[3-hydroxymyristoyl] glucosamine N-acyltransferase [Burkholderiales bacterium]|nr:UDP-3-O-[3-hydroxymyristoyl] glucosamine N-acyltransferase [Burkholderiales bacterium]
MARHDAPAAWTLAELAHRSGAALEGDGSVRIASVGTLEGAGDGAIAFLANPKYAANLGTTRATAVIVAPADAPRTSLPKLVTPHPYLTYARVATLLYPPAPPSPGVHATAVVDARAAIAPSASVGPHATVGAGASIGEGVVVGPGCAIGRDVRIGPRSRLDAHVVVYDGCVIGSDTLLCAGAVIGADGFGLAEDGGRWLRVPQVGRVVIGDRVEIGANTTIDRGAIDDTVIEDDVKLDNQIQIAHNCVIGEGTAIAGCVGIAGSTRVGRRCRIGGAASIAGHLSIPDGTTLGGATTVLSSIAEPGAYSGAYPVQPFGEWRRNAARLRQLDRLADRIAALERALAARERAD